MDEDTEFYEELAKLEAFQSDLKDVFEKHKVKLKRDVELYHGGKDDVIRIFIDKKRWISDRFDDVLEEIKVIE